MHQTCQVNLRISQLVFHEFRDNGDVIEYSSLAFVQIVQAASNNVGHTEATLICCFLVLRYLRSWIFGVEGLVRGETKNCQPLHAVDICKANLGGEHLCPIVR